MADKTPGGAAVAAPLVAQINRKVKLIFEGRATPETLVAEMTAARKDGHPFGEEMTASVAELLYN
jgi:hypothetical protein